jgi:DNA-binding response OmpR family regulator
MRVVKDGEVILVVDDEPPLLESMHQALTAAGYRTLTACDGVEALAALQSQSVDLIVADVAMPRMNGYQLYERVRENPAWAAIPFIFFTARGMDSDVRYGKELGVDDYLTKPCEPADLLASVRGKLRRARQLARQAPAGAPSPPEARPLVAGALRVDPAQHRAWLGREQVHLSVKEFAALEYLIRRAGQVVSSQELIQVTHGLDTDSVEAGTLARPLIFSLRRKLSRRSGDVEYIETVRGVGYRLAPLDD